MSLHFQPSLHGLVSVVQAPSVALSQPDGQIRDGGPTGFYSSDRRVLSVLSVEFTEARVTPVGHRVLAPASAVFSSQVRTDGDIAADAALVLHRHRSMRLGSFAERLEVVNFGAVEVSVRLRVRCASDLAPMHVVRGGREAALLVPLSSPGRLLWRSDTGDEAEMRTEPEPLTYSDDGGVASWEFELQVPAGGSQSIDLAVDYRPGPSEEADAQVFLQARTVPWPDEDSPAADPRVRRLRRQGLLDLEGLLLADPLRPDDRFLAAGSPWYFTLFGRDALWSAQLLLPLSTELAAGTLRALARRQGRVHNPAADEQPGKILHETRRETLRLGDMRLPPLYYGTIDATSLWVRLLHDAWRAGMPDEEVADLLPTLRSALTWLLDHGDADRDGFVEYVRGTSGGLANQGWKDTPEAVRWADGRSAQAPLALCEVQGYAYAAAVLGADLLEAFGDSGTDRWRYWAERLRERFRSAFWLTDEVGPYPAIALDADKRPVDGATSNMGHLLATGLLDQDEVAAVAGRLAAPDLDCGYGLRTLTSRSQAFNPLSYHCGSVWPHDTAIAVGGLALEGFHEEARSLAEGVLTAAEQFAFQLPELYGGTDARRGEAALAYPTSCRPQAWASAGAVAIAEYLTSRPLTGPGAARPHGSGLVVPSPAVPHA